MHVDEWLDTPRYGSEGQRYAQFVLEYMRMPAWKKVNFFQWMQQFKLFCTFKGEPYRCTGASRLGDIWLAVDPLRENGYDLRVAILDCSDWRDHQ